MFSGKLLPTSVSFRGKVMSLDGLRMKPNEMEVEAVAEDRHVHPLTIHLREINCIKALLCKSYRSVVATSSKKGFIFIPPHSRLPKDRTTITLCS